MTRVHVSVGSNVDREANLRFSLQRLGQLFGELAVSPVYESDAVGFEGDPFFNLVVVFDTERPVAELVAEFHAIESSRGRVRGGLGPRPLDIDLLTYGDEVGLVDGIRLPRDDVTRYAFVLRPLADVAPHDLHPVLGVSYSELWRDSPERDRTPMRRVTLSLSSQ